MSVLTVTINGTETDYGEVELTRGTSDALPTPEATVRSVPDSVATGADVTIASDGTTLFTGRVARPRVRDGGRRDLECEHQLAPLFEETVDVSDETDVATALSAAVADASTGATVVFTGSGVTLGEAYSAEGRTVRRVFTDLTERTGRVWRINDPDTIVVEPLGAAGSVTLDTGSDDAVVRQYDPGDVRTVVNDVTVNGTGAERVVGEASDAGSITDFGTRSETTNVNYITTQAEADDYAAALLRPDPLAAAKVTTSARATDVVSDRSNETLTLSAPSLDVNSVDLVIESQTNTSGGAATFAAGEGAASSLVTTNRENKSDDDNSEPGSVYNTDRLADDAVTTPKVVDLNITETKINDASISTPKLQAEAVIAEKIRANEITAREIDVLELSTTQITIGSGLDGFILFEDFNVQGGGTVAAMVPSSDNDSFIGLPGTRFAGIYGVIIDADELSVGAYDDVEATLDDYDNRLDDHDARISALESSSSN